MIYVKNRLSSSLFSAEKKHPTYRMHLIGREGFRNDSFGISAIGPRRRQGCCEQRSSPAIMTRSMLMKVHRSGAYLTCFLNHHSIYLGISLFVSIACCLEFHVARPLRQIRKTRLLQKSPPLAAQSALSLVPRR